MQFGKCGLHSEQYTMTGEATFIVVVPGETAIVFRMVVPGGTLRTVPEEGGIFCVAAAAAAKAAMPLIWELLPIA